VKSAKKTLKRSFRAEAQGIHHKVYPPRRAHEEHEVHPDSEVHPESLSGSGRDSLDALSRVKSEKLTPLTSLTDWEANSPKIRNRVELKRKSGQTLLQCHPT
jgi:hypothetical protein